MSGLLNLKSVFVEGLEKFDVPDLVDSLPGAPAIFDTSPANNESRY